MKIKLYQLLKIILKDILEEKRYKINIDFDIECNDIKEDMKMLKEILKEIIPISKQKKNEMNTKQGGDKPIKVTSVYLLKNYIK